MFVFHIFDVFIMFYVQVCVCFFNYLAVKQIAPKGQ